MKVAFACPSYGPIEPVAAASQRAAIMTAWTNGIQVRSDIFVDKVGWEGSRNIIAKAFLLLSPDFQGIFWCDSDSVLPQNAIMDTVGPGQDIVTGIYHGRHPPFEPKIFAYKKSTDSFFHVVKYPSEALFPVDGCGFGCVYTSRKALELTAQIEQEPTHVDVTSGEIKKEPRTYWFKFGRYSEDLTWCKKARDEGLIIWCNPNVKTGHLGEVNIIGPKNREEFVKENPESAGVAYVPDEDDKRGTIGLNRTPEHHNIILEEDMRMKASA